MTRPLRGLERFQELYGQFPRSMANHSGCDEGIYWGFDRLTGYRRLLYKQWMRLHGRGAHRGHRKGDPLFWGDICRDRIEYVRSFQFSDINTLAGCPMMPYHDPGRPFVNQWFASSEGAEINAFNRCVSEANQDRLEEEGGACIMYTHLASGFSEDGRVQARFAELMDRLSRKNGWFVPVNTLLDYIVEQRGPRELLPAERRRLEHRWLAGKLKTGPS